jgi:hypothetical protein
MTYTASIHMTVFPLDAPTLASAKKEAEKKGTRLDRIIIREVTTNEIVALRFSEGGWKNSVLEVK